MKKVAIIPVLCILALISAQAQDPWVLSAASIQQENYSAITVGNGMLGIVSSPEPLKTSRIVLYGIYDQGLAQNAFNLFEVSLRIDGEEPRIDNITEYRQELNMKEGIFIGSFRFRDKALVKYSYLALRHLPYVAMLDIEIQAVSNIDLQASNFIENPSVHWDSYANYQNPQNAYREIKNKVNCLSITAKNVSGQQTLTGMTSFLFSEPDAPQIQVRDRIGNARFRAGFTKSLKAGEHYAFAIAGSVMSTCYNPYPLTECERLNTIACLEGRERLLAMHKKEWAKLWQSDILIEGDPQSQQDIHNILYHLYSFIREGSEFSIPPHGLSELDYNSHIFWDADVWIFPALVLLHPEMAKSMVEYRFNRLEQAKRNAFARGYRGAMFPWESADVGVEESPSWSLTGAFEHHNTAGVSFAAWNYYCVTQDLDWLRKKGYPMISECADFWTSRVEQDANGNYEIINVVGADEHAENVDNDAYTNGAARKNLEIAGMAAKLVGATPNPQWSGIAAKIIIHKFPDGITREYKGYAGQNVTQADVSLLAYPLGIITGKEQILKDLKYYEPRIDANGPAMTYCMFSLLYSRLGDADEAFKKFQHSYRPNQKPPFGVISERPAGAHPFFITAGGGILQAVLMGFGGLEITPQGVAQKKGILPPLWEHLKFTSIGKDHKMFEVTR